MRNVKRLVALLLVMIFTISISAPGLAAVPFSDVNGHANEADILKLKTVGVLNGYPEGYFLPNSSIKRAEFAKILVNALGLESYANVMQATPSNFKDVKENYWAKGYIAVASAKGLIKGYPDGTFMPEANIKGSEAISMLVRALGVIKSEAPGGLWYVENVIAAFNLGIIPDLRVFNPDKLASRGEIATYSARFLAIPVNKDTGLRDSDPAKNNLVRLNVLAGELKAFNSEAGSMIVQGASSQITLKVAKEAILKGDFLPGVMVEYILINNEVKYAAVVTNQEKMVYGRVKAVNNTKISVVPTGNKVVVEYETAVPGLFNGVHVDDAVKIVLDEHNQVKTIAANPVTVIGILQSKTKAYANGILTQTIVADGKSYVVLNNATINRKAPVSGTSLGNNFDSLKIGDRLVLNTTLEGKVKGVEAIPINLTTVVSKAYEATTTQPAIIMAEGTTYQLISEAVVTKNGQPVKVTSLVGEKVRLTWTKDEINLVAKVETNERTVSGFIVTKGNDFLTILPDGQTINEKYYLSDEFKVTRNDEPNKTLADLKIDDQVTAEIDSNDRIKAVIARELTVKDFADSVSDSLIKLDSGARYGFSETVINKPATIDPDKKYVLVLTRNGEVKEVRTEDVVVIGVVTGTKETIANDGLVIRVLTIDGVDYTVRKDAPVTGTRDEYRDILVGDEIVKAILTRSGYLKALETYYADASGTVDVILSNTDNLTGKLTRAIMLVGQAQSYSLTDNAGINLNGTEGSFNNIKIGAAVKLISTKADTHLVRSVIVTQQ